MAQEAKVTNQAVPGLQFTDWLTATERVAKSGGSLVVAIPKPIADLLQLETRNVVEIKIRKVGAPAIKPSRFEAP